MKAKLHGTYLILAKHKDPVIDFLRTPRGECEMKTGRIATVAGVAHGTVRNMFDGPTRRPQWATVLRIARAIGPGGEEALMRCIREGGRTLKLVPRQRAATPKRAARQG